MNIEKFEKFKPNNDHYLFINLNDYKKTIFDKDSFLNKDFKFKIYKSDKDLLKDYPNAKFWPLISKDETNVNGEIYITLDKNFYIRFNKHYNKFFIRCSDFNNKNDIFDKKFLHVLHFINNDEVFIYVSKGIIPKEVYDFIKNNNFNIIFDNKIQVENISESGKIIDYPKYSKKDMEKSFEAGINLKKDYLFNDWLKDYDMEK